MTQRWFHALATTRNVLSRLYIWFFLPLFFFFQKTEFHSNNSQLQCRFCFSRPVPLFLDYIKIVLLSQILNPLKLLICDSAVFFFILFVIFYLFGPDVKIKRLSSFIKLTSVSV